MRKTYGNLKTNLSSTSQRGHLALQGGENVIEEIAAQQPHIGQGTPVARWTHMAQWVHAMQWVRPTW